MAKDVRRALMIARKPRQTGGSYSLNDVRAGGIGPSQLGEEKPTFMGMRPEQLSKIAAGAPGYEHLQQAAYDWLADNPQNPPSATVGDILQRQDMGYAYADGGDVAPRAYRDDSGQFTYEGQPVKPEAPYEGPDAFGQRWRVDDMLVPAGETAPDQMTPRLTYRGGPPLTDYRIGRNLLGGGRDGNTPFRSHWGLAQGGAVESKEVKRALMIARDQRALLRRVANIYPGPAGGMDPSPGGGGYSGPGGGKYIGPSHYADGGAVSPERRAKITEHNELLKQIRPLAAKGGLTGAEARRFRDLTARMTDLKFDLAKPGHVDKVLPQSETMNAMHPEAVVAAHTDYHRSRPIHKAVSDAAAGVGFDKNTAIDDIMDGKHPDVTPRQFYDNFQSTRDALRKHHGDAMTLYRSEGRQMPKATKNWATTSEFASQFGPNVISQKVPVDNIVGANVLTNGKYHELIVGKPPSIAKAAGGSVPPFKLYSGAAKVIAAKGQAKATPQQYAAMPGIKPDELKYSKFDTLGSKALPREEVIKHLEDNALPLQETLLRHHEGDYVPHDDARDDDGDAKFSDKVLPGGKNYREVLLHLPETRGTLKEYPVLRADGVSDGRYTTQEAAERRAAQIDGTVGAPTSTGVVTGFRSAHWKEPDVLAHVRMSDRKGPNGEKVLHVEEVQSDWGQQTRERGIRIPGDNARATAINAQMDEVARRADDWTRAAELPEYQELARQLTEASTKNPKGVPAGPYVDNTQKWTDLALKRVLHEAAHGGYDKIAFTPGDEQNKRYDLSSQVKNIQYYPDTKHLGATTHDNRGVEHEGVEPDDLSKHIGKEAADRILKQGMQRYEGRGKLGGEFYHELEGEGLKVGGEGMRGYYDNILPKRLQTLAQQHDPQAKVNLHAHDLAAKPSDPFEEHKQHYADSYQAFEGQPHTNDAELRNWARDFSPDDFHGVDDDPVKAAPLHSLDVTPQMRDSIKANGFNSFKRGGEVDDDPIKDWQWRPTEDVRNELQLDEIPSHVHKFGEFMDETARRAATQGLTPRDLIKAYAITRSSIGRGALPVATVRRPKKPEYGFDALPKGLQGTLRPEGAMGHWLHTKMGQRYLDEAEAGRVDEEAVRDAIKSMGAFGLPDKAEGKALRWAPKNLPGQEGRVSELIARAHRGQSSPEEWRGEMRVPGIAESKAGFFAAMLGRGDQPTLDARQIILNTGQSTKKAAPYLSPKGAKEAAVNRLADRQTELGLKHDKSMSPFYQHLAHHTIWDKVGNEETTHDDLMQALRGAKDGGAINGATFDNHPVSRVMRKIGPQGLKRGGAAPDDDRMRAYMARVLSPFSDDPDVVRRALEVVAGYKNDLTAVNKDAGYYKINQAKAPQDVTSKINPLKGVTLKDKRFMTWEDLHREGEDGSIINLGGDRQNLGRLTHINGKKLAWGVDLHAGPRYMLEPNPDAVWSNNLSHATGLKNKILDAAAKNKGPVYGVYSPMGPRAVDSSHNMFDAVMAQIPGSDIDPADAAEFDRQIMNGMHAPVAKRAKAREVMAKWPGIADAKAASEFARTLPGVHRSAIIKHMDKNMWLTKGFPAIGMTRMAITDPDVAATPGNMLGHRVVRLDPDKIAKETRMRHSTYSYPTGGEYVGDIDLAPRQDAMPEPTEQMVANPDKHGQIIHPYSQDFQGRSAAGKMFEEQKQIQPLNTRQLDSVMSGIERYKKHGFKRGGIVSRALDIARKINGR